jgi:hypothetical protein
MQIQLDVSTWLCNQFEPIFFTTIISMVVIENRGNEYKKNN